MNVEKKPHYPLRYKLIVAPLVFGMAVLLGESSGAPMLGTVFGVVAVVALLNAMG